MQKMRVYVLLRCCFCCDLAPALRAAKETARRRRRSPCYVLVSTLSALLWALLLFLLLHLHLHCSHWWCCCGLCYAQLLYLLLQRRRHRRRGGAITPELDPVIPALHGLGDC